VPGTQGHRGQRDRRRLGQDEPDERGWSGSALRTDTEREACPSPDTPQTRYLGGQVDRSQKWSHNRSWIRQLPDPESAWAPVHDFSRGYERGIRLGGGGGGVRGGGEGGRWGKRGVVFPYFFPIFFVFFFFFWRESPGFHPEVLGTLTTGF